MFLRSQASEQQARQMAADEKAMKDQVVSIAQDAAQEASPRRRSDGRFDAAG